MRHRIASVTIVLAGALPLQAAEGRIPVWQPTVIAQPGHYVVTRDISAAAGPILDIRAEDVTVDLNGHALVNGDTTSPVVEVAPPASSGRGFLVLRNGKIQGGMCGVHVIPPDMLNVRLLDLRIGGSAEEAIQARSFGDLEARGIIIINSKVGFDLQGQPPDPCTPPDPCHPRATITESSVQSDVGVRCTGAACRLVGNTITSCRTAIELQNADDSQVRGSVLSVPGSEFCFNPQPEPPGDVIEISGSTGVAIEGNTVQGDAVTRVSNGVRADAGSHGMLLRDNVVGGAGNDGFQVLGSHAFVTGNLIHGSGDDGIAIGGSDSLVDDNKVGGNAGLGVEFLTGGHAYRDNMLRANTAGAVGGPGAATSTDAGGNIP